MTHDETLAHLLAELASARQREETHLRLIERLVAALEALSEREGR